MPRALKVMDSRFKRLHLYAKHCTTEALKGHRKLAACLLRNM